MLIEVKATQKAEAEPQGAKRFEFNTAERLSRLPAYLALMVIGIASYIRSITGASARTPDEVSVGKAEETVTAPPRTAVAQAEGQAVPGDQAKQEADADESPRHGSIQRGNPWPEPFQVPEFPQLHFVAPKFYLPNVRPFVPVTVMAAPYNDNFHQAAVPGGGPSAPAAAVKPDPHPANPSQNDGSGTDAVSDEVGEGGENADDDGGERAANHAPVVVGPVRLHDVFAGQAVLIGLVHLLRGASDPDGDPLGLTDLVVEGAEFVATDQGWLLQTRPGMVGPIAISYRVTDGEAWVSQSASLDIVRMQHHFGNGDDVIVASPYDDDVSAAAGDDIVDALAGDDHVDGGGGDDHINGGSGDDVLVGGAGNDIIFGGGGDDVISGGEGEDRLFGEAGHDTILGEQGDDYIEGGAGRDHLDGGEGDDTLVGGDGIDRLIGGAGHDRLDGGEGDDLLEGSEGNDSLAGGSGNDVLVDGAGDDVGQGGEGDDLLSAGPGDDVLDGGAGHDVLDLSAAQENLVVDMIGGTSYGGDLGVDCFTAVEEVVGGAGDDLFVVGGKATIVSGGRGRDTFVFEVTDHDPGLSDEVVHKILDFVVGDRVRVRDYDLSREARNAERDLFKTIYDDDEDDWLRSDVPLQVTHTVIDDEDWTIIMADLNGDTINDIAISIQGVQLSPPDHLA